MRIGVYGSATGPMNEYAIKIAYELGRKIAQRGHIVVTGGCAGIPYEAVRGASVEGGKAIAFSPASSKELHIEGKLPTEGFTEYFFVPSTYEHAEDALICRKYRNVSSVASCDAVIVISGQYGTLNEFTVAYDLLKPIGVLTGTGGFADLLQEITQKIRKEPSPPIVFSSDPEEILNQLESIVSNMHK